MKQVSVLIVEDDPWFAAEQRRTLERAGLMVTIAENGLEAIGLLDRSPPDVLILDMFLPGPNALALLHETRSYADLAAIPVVVCTASAGLLHGESLAAYGVRTVLDKSTMHPDDMVVAVRRVL